MTTPIVPQATAIRSITYTAPSATTEGQTYRVVVDDAGWHCDCTAGHYKRECWHKKSARCGLLGKPVVRLEWAIPAPATEHERAITAAQASRAAYRAAAKTAGGWQDLYGE